MDAAATACGQAEILDLTADEVLAAIRSRRFTARDYIHQVLERARCIASVNAFITLLPDEALSAADRIDTAIAKGQTLPPLAGLAIVAKDNINMQGLPTSGGTAALRNSRPRTTAPSLQKLLDAGAIVIGKTNMHELAFGITSTNLSSFAGPVRNPYDTLRIAGGSSGGTAVAIATRVVTCGLGTDTGASTRLPAALTGTVGMRPSVGNGGAERRYHDDNAVVPVSRTRDTVGAMGRSVADVSLLDSAISGRPRVHPIELRGLRLGVPPCMWSGLDKELEKVALAARDALLAAGVVLVDEDMPNLRQLNDNISFQIALHEPLADLPAYLEASGIKDVTLADIVRGIASPDVKGAFDAVMNDVFGDAYEEAMQVHRPALQQLYADHFKIHRLDALLFPTTVLPAAPIDSQNGSSTVSINGGEPVDTFATYIRNTDPGSNAGIPGLSIPVGMTVDGLPVGLEIDGPIGSDENLLGMGLAMERVLDRLPAPKL